MYLDCHSHAVVKWCSNTIYVSLELIQFVEQRILFPLIKIRILYGLANLSHKIMNPLFGRSIKLN
ncbi:hypothetical protein DXT94_18420 [Rhizobium sp. ICMP 5592]|nr:hypothetical protein [Rhizobium sp. ICMP 5592]